MKADFITLLRIALVFVAVSLYTRGFFLNAIATFLVASIIIMDALDGYVARRYGETSDQGAVFDILGDRIVENVLWIYFACIGQYSFWIPVIVITRDVVVDNVRSLAFAEGKTAFGEKTMLRAEWARLLVASKLSRGLYAGFKGLCFCFLGVVITLESAGAPQPLMGYLTPLKSLIIYATVAFCLLRGLPVIWDGRDYLLRGRLKEPSQVP